MTLPLRTSGAPVLVSFALFAGGCGSDEGIRSYTVPRTTERESRPPASEYRLLGAMYPENDPIWFFKFNGPSDQIAKYEADFDKLAASVKAAPTAGVPEFTLPDGWKRGGPRGDIVAETIKTPDGSMEITVSRSQGGVTGNLGRWIKMIGLKAGPTDRELYTKPIDAVGGKGLRVDLRGPNDPTTAQGMMGKPR